MKRAFWAAVVVLVIALGTFALVHTPMVRRYALRRAIAAAETDYGIRLDAQELRYDLVGLRVELRGARVTAIGQDGPPFFEAARLAVQLPAAIFAGRFQIESLAVDEGRLTIVRREDGRTNVPVGSDRGGATEPLSIGSISARRLAIEITDRSSGITVLLPALDATISTQSGRLYLREPGVVTRGSIRRRVHDIRGGLSFDGRVVRLSNLTVRTDDVSATVSGDAAVIDDNPRLNLHAQIRADAAAIARWTASEPAPAGDLHVGLRLTGPIAAPIAAVEVTSPRLAVRSMTLTEIAAKATVSAAAVLVEHIDARVAGGYLEGSGGLRLAEQDAQLNLTWNRVDVEALTRMFDRSLTPRPTGRSAGALTASGPLRDLSQWTVVGHVTVGEGVTARQRVAVTGRVDLRVERGWWALDAARPIEIGGVAVRPDLGGRLNPTALDRSSVRGVVALPNTDLVPLANALQRLGVLGTDIGPIDGSIDAKALISGTLTRPEVNVVADARIADVAQLSPAVGFHAPASVNLRSDLRMAQFKADVPALSVSAAGRVELKEPYAATVHVEAEHLPLETVLRGLAVPAPVAGAVSAAVDASGPLTRWRHGRAELTIERLEARVGDLPVRLESPARASVDVDVVHVTSLNLRAGAVGVSAFGRLPLTDAATTVPDAAMQVTATGDLAQFLNAVAATGIVALPEIAGSGPAALLGRVTGSFARPLISADLELGPGQIQLTGLPPATNVNLRVHSDGTWVELRDLRAEWQGSTVRAEGRAPIQLSSGTAGVATLDARIASITPRVLAPFIEPEAFSQLEGIVDATLHLQTPSLALSDVSGEVRLDRMELRLGQLPIVQRMPTRVSVRDGFAQIDAWEWAGQGGTAGVRGRMRLSDRTAAVIVNGNFDLRILTPFTSPAGVTIAGALEPRLSITGPIDTPRIDGVAAIRDGVLRLREPRLIASDLNGSIVLTRQSAHLGSLAGQVNGGTLEASGRLDYQAGAALDSVLRVRADRIALEYPEGLHSELNVDLEASVTVPTEPADPSGRVTGVVSIVRSAYREPIALAGGLLAALRTRRLAAQAAGEPTLIDNMTLDVRVVSEEAAMTMDNNLGRLAVGADLRVIGTVAAPALSGQAQIADGGQLFLGRNRYEIESGTIDFANPVAIDPILNIKALTRVAGEDIELTITGSAEELQIEPTPLSDSDLSREDLFALLLTGRKLDDISGDEAEIVGEQALAFLSGDVLGFASRAVGLDVIRLGGLEERTGSGDPLAIASRVNPAARLTFGKSVGRDIDITFSQDLRDADAQTWIVDYRPRRQLEFRFVSDDENLRSYELRHDVAFGGLRASGSSIPSRRANVTRRVGSVVIDGARLVSEQRLRDVLELEAGDEFEVAVWQTDRDRVEALLREEGFLQARVNARIAGDESPALTYSIVEGPHCTIEIGGYAPDEDTIGEIRRAWSEAIFDELVVEEARSILTGRLSRSGYVQPVVEGSLVTVDDRKTLAINVEPGHQVLERSVRFQGAPPLLEPELRVWMSQLSAAEAIEDPAAVERGLTAWLRERGYVRARVKVGQLRLDGSEAIVPIEVEAGPAMHVTAIHIEGARAKTTQEVIDAAGLATEVPFDAVAIDAARDRVRARYRRDGFPEARVEARSAIDERAAAVAITLAIREGPRQVLRAVTISGNRSIDADVITRALQLPTGEPVTVDDWLAARRRLFDTRLFRRADVTPEPMMPVDPDAAEVPMRARVVVQEWPVLRLRYGLQLAEERPEGELEGREVVPGLSADVMRRTVFGRAVTLGGAVNYQRREQSARALLRAPTLLGWPIESSLSAERSRESFAAATLVTNGTGISWEQRVRPRRDLSVSYSYQFERNRTFDTEADPDDEFAFDLTVKVAWLNAALAWDTRDDVADPSRGWLLSSSVDWAPAGLGTDLRFVKHVGQAYYFRPWRRLVFASAARIGTAVPLGGQDLVPSERYFAGGARSVRGIGEDLLGPRLLGGDPAGGESLLVLNQEVRFPVYRWLRGVAFVDAGNVFAEAAGVRLGDLVTAYGVGIRLATPFAPLIRVDYGRLFSPRAGEPGGRWFLGIGQAF